MHFKGINKNWEEGEFFWDFCSFTSVILHPLSCSLTSIHRGSFNQYIVIDLANFFFQILLSVVKTCIMSRKSVHSDWSYLWPEFLAYVWKLNLALFFILGQPQTKLTSWPYIWKSRSCPHNLGTWIQCYILQSLNKRDIHVTSTVSIPSKALELLYGLKEIIFIWGTKLLGCSWYG